MSSGIKQSKAMFGMNEQATSNIDAPVRGVVIVGENPDIDTTTIPETVWEVGGVYDFPTAASVCTIVSTDAADTYGSGTGGWIILIEGVDENYREQWEVVNLDGVTPVVSTKSYLRVNFFRVVYSGTGMTNAGTISCTVDSKEVRHITIGESMDHTAVYTVPLGHTFFITSNTFSVVKSATNINASLVTHVYVPVTNTTYESSKTGIASNGGPSGTTFQRDSRPKIPEKADLYYDIEYVSGNNCDAAVVVRGLLVKHGYIDMFI